jgi:beta-mannosidase
VPAKAAGVLRWDLFHLDGRVLLRGQKRVALRYGESTRQKTLNLAGALAKHGRDSVYLRIALEVDGRCVSEDTVFLTPPRFLTLPQAKTRATVQLLGPKRAAVTFTSSAFQHRFTFDLAGIAHRASDNYFELYPREPKTVEVELERPQSVARLLEALTYHSLVDTY